MAEDVNPFLPPRADSEPEPEAGGLDVQRALAGNYDYGIGEVMSEAWQKLDGFKAPFWGTAIVAMVITFALQIGAGVVQFALVKVVGAFLAQGFGYLVGALVGAISYPVFYLPVTDVSLRHLDGRQTNMKTVFDYSSRLAPYLGLGLLSILFMTLGLLLLVIPGIYLYVCYVVSVPLMMEGRFSAGETLRISRIVVGRRWWKLFGLLFVTGLVNLIAAIPLGIGLIWTAPWTALCLLTAYRRMFGPAPASAMD